MYYKTVLFLAIIMLFSSTLASKLKTNKLNTKVFLQEIRNQTSSQVFCFLNTNGTVYDLNPVNTKTDYVISEGNYKVNFNVCKNPQAQCPNTTSMVTYLGPNNQCVRLAGPELVVSKWTVLSN